MPEAIVVVTSGVGEPDRRATFDQSFIVHVQLDEQIDHEHRISMHVVDTGVDGEMISALNHAEPEAIPLQWTRRGENELTPLCCRHLAVFGCDVLNISRVGCGVSNDPIVIVELEPAVVGVVAAKISVDDIRHCADIAAALNVPRRNQQPGHLQPVRRVRPVGANVLLLLVAGGHIRHRGLRELVHAGR